MISYRKKSFVVHVEAEAEAGAEAEAATKRLVGLTSALGLVGDADALGVLFKVTDQPLSSKAYTRVKGRTYLRALHTSLLKNLLENIILLGVLAKLVLKLLLAGRVEDTLLAVSARALASYPSLARVSFILKPREDIPSEPCEDIPSATRMSFLKSRFARLRSTYSGTKTFHPATTSTMGIVLSAFHF